MFNKGVNARLENIELRQQELRHFQSGLKGLLVDLSKELLENQKSILKRLDDLGSNRTKISPEEEDPEELLKTELRKKFKPGSRVRHSSRGFGTIIHLDELPGRIAVRLDYNNKTTRCSPAFLIPIEDKRLSKN